MTEQPEMIKFFTDDGEILVRDGDPSPFAPYRENHAPVWISILVIIFSIMIALTTFAILAWSVVRIF